jgi:hypothetical protein
LDAMTFLSANGRRRSTLVVTLSTWLHRHVFDSIQSPAAVLVDGHTAYIWRRLREPCPASTATVGGNRSGIKISTFCGVRDSAAFEHALPFMETRFEVRRARSGILADRRRPLRCLLGACHVRDLFRFARRRISLPSRTASRERRFCGDRCSVASSRRLRVRRRSSLRWILPASLNKFESRSPPV